MTVEEIVVEGDRFASRHTVSGTHTGELMGIPATNAAFKVPSVDLGRVEAGRAVERWGGLDMFALLVQLGLFPTPA